MSVTNAFSPVGLSLRSNFVWTLIGNIVYAGSQWLILVILAKIGSPALVGRFSLALAITAPVLMLTNLQLRAIQATDAKGEYQFGEYLGLRLLTAVLALGVILAVVVLGNHSREAATLILVIGLAKSFESISDVSYGLMQKHERMDWISVSMMIKGPLSLVSLAGIFWMTHNLIYGALGMMLVWLGLLVVYDLRNARRLEMIQPIFNRATLLQLLTLAIPLGLVMMLVSLNSNIPRYFLERLWGEAGLGYFSALAYLMLVGNTVVGALGQSATPRLAKSYASGDHRSFSRLLIWLAGIGVVMGGLGMALALLFGRQILTLLYRPDYAEQVPVFIWLMFVAAVNYIASFMGYGMTAARYFRVQLPLAAIITGVLIIACAILIPLHGLTGAAQAMGIASVVQLGGGIAINIHAIRALKQTSAPKGILA